MPHGNHIYSKEYDTAKATMCAYPQSYHALPHWKCVIQCCSKCTCVNLPDQETDDQYSYTRPSIRFQIYHIIARCLGPRLAAAAPTTNTILSQGTIRIPGRK